MTAKQIIKALGEGKLNTYDKTFTKEHRKILIKEGYWWLKYKGIEPYETPFGGEIAARGECQMKATKSCKGYDMYIMTSHYGSNIVPACHACWSTISDD